MLQVSRSRIRTTCIALVVFYLAAAVSMWAERHGYLGSAARNASMWRYQGLLVPVWLLFALSFVPVATFVPGVVGTFMLRRWGRSMLAASLVIAFLVAPLRGEVVYGPLTLLAGGAVTVLHMWLITVMYWSPASALFDANAPGKTA